MNLRSPSSLEIVPWRCLSTAPCGPDAFLNSDDEFTILQSQILCDEARGTLHEPWRRFWEDLVRPTVLTEVLPIALTPTTHHGVRAHPTRTLLTTSTWRERSPDLCTTMYPSLFLSGVPCSHSWWWSRDLEVADPLPPRSTSRLNWCKHMTSDRGGSYIFSARATQGFGWQFITIC
jgi:hypothetical protein